MKRHQNKYNGRYGHNKERLIEHRLRGEQNGFKCSHCKRWVVVNEYMGTANRNHCNLCLWSKHVDVKKGDRQAGCQGGMQPIGLTFRIEGDGLLGEIMLIHDCKGCDKVSINRLAADDLDTTVLEVFEASQHLEPDTITRLQMMSIRVAQNSDRPTILRGLFGDTQA